MWNPESLNEQFRQDDLSGSGRQAMLEKLFSAERNITLVRTVVILINTNIYLLSDKSHSIEWLTYTIIIVAWIYTGFVHFFQPYRKYPVMLGSYFTYSFDAIFITLWVYSTGAFQSSFFILFYLSIVAVAFRFNLKVILLTASLYSGLYMLLLLMTDETQQNLLTGFLRCSYIFLVGYSANLIAKETYTQTREKLLMKQLVEEAREAGEKLRISENELRETTEALRILNEKLEEKVRKRTLELEESVSKFKMLLESIPLLAWTTTPDGKTTYRNKVYYDFTGKTEKDDFSLAKIIHPEDLQKSVDVWEKVRKTGEPFEVEYRWIRQDGKEIWMLGRAVPLKNPDGKIRLWIGTATDIQEQKLLQEQKEQFIGIASHEMKTPLTSIKAYAQLVERSLESKEFDQAEKFIHKTGVFINRLQNLISDLLDVSKIQSGKLVYQMEDFEFNDLAAETIESMQHMSHTHHIKLETASDFVVYADRQRIEQVMNNLISNAIKYSPDANEIFVKVEANEKHVHVSVQDFGLGIPKDKLTKIFDRFYRVNDSITTISGLGIGLFITKEILTRHNGQIWVDSEPGKGSTFHFTIPYQV